MLTELIEANLRWAARFAAIRPADSRAGPGYDNPPKTQKSLHAKNVQAQLCRESNELINVSAKWIDVSLEDSVSISYIHGIPEAEPDDIVNIERGPKLVKIFLHIF